MSKRICLAVVATVIFSTTSVAQKPISVLVGAGRSVDAKGPISLKSSDVTLGVQLDFPMSPISLRAEGMVAGNDITHSPRSFFATLIVPVRSPGVTPYGLVSWGAYDYGKSTEIRGLNYGGGVRLGAGGLGLYGEVRRHEKLKSTIATIGLAF